MRCSAASAVFYIFSLKKMYIFNIHKTTVQ